MDDSCLVSPEAAAAATVDALRQLLSTLGALLASPAGGRAAQDATESRSLPSLAKAMRRLWFDTECGEGWDSKEQALWLCHLLAVSEGSRGGLLSFYGAGILVCGALRVFAEVVMEEAGQQLDQAWDLGANAVQEVLHGRHWEKLQQWPADRRCGGGKDPLLSVDRLPDTVKRTLDLEGVKLTRVQAVGLGAAMLLPGVMTVGMGGIGCALLVKSMRDRAKSGSEGDAGNSKWQSIQSQCLQHAHRLLRRKSCPIQIRYERGSAGPRTVRVCLYGLDDPLCAVPVGGLGAGGEGSALLGPGGHCTLRPSGLADSFRLRAYRPGPLLDLTLHDGVETRRGDRLRIVATAEGHSVRIFAEAAPRQASASAPGGAAAAASGGGAAPEGPPKEPVATPASAKEPAPAPAKEPAPEAAPEATPEKAEQRREAGQEAAPEAVPEG